jgi:hypothetical protein
MHNNDMDHLNLLPINQLAANKLRMAGVAADPSMLAVFQLMRWGWGLDDDVPMTHRRAATELDRLCRDPAPGEALDYLVANVPGGMSELHRILGRLTPRPAAQLLLDVLNMRLKADHRKPCPSEDHTG